jgi:hypothetical protein
MFFSWALISTSLAIGVSGATLRIKDVQISADPVLHHDLRSLISHVGAVERDVTPYWYEAIAHQGISAFGPAGYQVFRNVKDYGAKGSSIL